MWPSTQGPANDTYYVGANPQYTLIIDKMNTQINSVWILFSRHCTVKEQAEMNSINKDDDGDFFAVHVFR